MQWLVSVEQLSASSSSEAHGSLLCEEDEVPRTLWSWAFFLLLMKENGKPPEDLCWTETSLPDAYLMHCTGLFCLGNRSNNALGFLVPTAFEDLFSFIAQ